MNSTTTELSGDNRGWGITQKFDFIIGGPESDYDDGESELLYARSNDEFE